MKQKTALALSTSMLLIISGLAFSQEQAAKEEAAPVALAEPEVLWVWGEVVSVDLANKTLLIRYPDYEADQEKEMTVGVDEKTTYENATYLDSIKPADTVSIDYTLGAEGKIIAGHISVEKPEAQTTEAAPPLEPETAAQPGAPQ